MEIDTYKSRLRAAGFSPEDAERLVASYVSACDLDGLEDYISSHEKEAKD